MSEFILGSSYRLLPENKKTVSIPLAARKLGIMPEVLIVDGFKVEAVTPVAAYTHVGSELYVSVALNREISMYEEISHATSD